MNREQRRHAAKLLRLGDAEEEMEGACILCAFVKVQVVGSREQLYKDKQGRRIELGISHRLEAPYGLRWPYDLQSRPPCHECKGSGRLSSSFVKDGEIVKQESLCQPCKGLGRELRGDEFAPLCEPCAQFVYAWLEARARKHMEEHMTAGGRLQIATPAMLAQMLAGGMAAGAPTPGLARIGLPGIRR